MGIISFDDIIERVLERSEEAIHRLDFKKARSWYETACNLYSQHPTGNHFIEARKLDLYRTLFER